MKGRIPNLDLFRFIAISTVIYFHLAQRFLSAYYVDNTLINIGKYGVEMFFALSGFLIGSIYYKSSNVNLLRFWLQRFLRTYPPYFIALFIYYALAYISKKQAFDFGYLIFIQNLYQKIPIFKISWSLCVEEHFYLIFPLLILVVDRWMKNKHVSLSLWIILCLLPTVLRYQFGDYSNSTWGYYITASIFRFDGIAVGCLLAFIVNKYNITSWRSSQLFNLLLFISLIAIAYWLEGAKSSFKYSIGYFILIINTGLLLLSFYLSGNITGSTSVVVKRTAAMAYSLYLTHALLIDFFDKVQDKYSALGYLLTLACLFCVLITGYVYYIFIEKKSIVLRNRILGH